MLLFDHCKLTSELIKVLNKMGTVRDGKGPEQYGLGIRVKLREDGRSKTASGSE